MNPVIRAVEYYLPQDTISSKELADRYGFDLSFIENKVGVRQVYHAEDGETSTSMGIKAAEKLLVRFPGLREEIQVLIICTQTPDCLIPHRSAVIQGALGLSENTACFDISLGCSGFVYGISILKAFLKAHGFGTGLLITTECYSSIIHKSDKNTMPIFSDGAAATLVSEGEGIDCLAPTFGTRGTHADHLTMSKPEGESEERLYMNGRGIFEFVAGTLPCDIRNCLRINGLTIDRIDYFVFHQASAYMIETLAKKTGIRDTHKVVLCLDRFANTVSSSIPMALKYLLARETRRPLTLLASGFGVGLSWGSIVLRVPEGMGEL